LTTAYLNRVSTTVPPHDVHQAFVRFARTLLADKHGRALFDRMADRAHISHRFSVLAPSTDPEGHSVDADRFYARGRFPTTGDRMRLFEEHAPALGERAVAGLGLGAEARRITHVIVTSCTGMYAPGLDIELAERCGLDPSVERTMVGFMGCYAAVNALKLARHIVRSTPEARVLTVNLELCSLHLQETSELEQMLSFLIFGDGCAASVVSADPVGFALDSFRTVLVPDTREQITWKVRDRGFDMVLSGRVPASLEGGLGQVSDDILDGKKPEAIDHWAVHPGGHSVLDAVQHALALPSGALSVSREVLRRFGNMSSATIMFVLQEILAKALPGEHGCAMSFGPGLTAETLLFRAV
jgi:predicted naringenin-chalcone synthase